MGLAPDSEKEHQQMVLVSQEGTMTLDLHKHSDLFSSLRFLCFFFFFCNIDNVMIKVIFSDTVLFINLNHNLY